MKTTLFASPPRSTLYRSLLSHIKRHHYKYQSQAFHLNFKITLSTFCCRRHLSLTLCPSHKLKTLSGVVFSRVHTDLVPLFQPALGRDINRCINAAGTQEDFFSLNFLLLFIAKVASGAIHQRFVVDRHHLSGTLKSSLHDSGHDLHSLSPELQSLPKSPLDCQMRYLVQTPY